VRFESWRAHA